jgi:signal transduction histidine kinase
MNSTSASSSADLTAPLPARQFRGFLLFFHIVILGMLALTLIAHLRHVTGALGASDFTLIGLVVIQSFLYVCFFALPSLAEHWGARRWFGVIFRDMNEFGRVNLRLALRWFAGFLVVSVALVLAECRVEPAFQWALIAYVGMISSLPFRFSVPATMAIFGAWLLNWFGWSALTTWGFLRWFDLLVQVTPGAALLLFMGRIITTSGERGKLIAELQAAQQALELAHERELELAALRERERLARDLHDTLGHALVTLTVQLEAAQRLQGVDPARATTLLAEMQKLTRSSMEGLRRSLDNHRTPGLGDRSLPEALQALCAEAANRCGAAIDCQLAEGADSLPPAVAEALWRVAQEGLTNVEKHAHARHVRMNLTLPSKEVVLRATDDGIGLSPGAEEKPGHYGLRGLRERVEGLGGTFTVATAGTAGTVVEARLPLIA